MHQWMSHCIDQFISSRTAAKRKGIKAEHWWRSIIFGKLFIALPHILTFVFTSEYIFCIILKHFLGIPFSKYTLILIHILHKRKYKWLYHSRIWKFIKIELLRENAIIQIQETCPSGITRLSNPKEQKKNEH